MTLLVFAAASAVVALGCLVQSSVGFGSNLVAMPLIALFAPELVPGSVLVAVIAMNLLVLRRDRQSVDVRPISGAIAGRVVGTVLGVVLLGQLSADGLKLTIAIAVLFMVIVASVGVAPRRTLLNMGVAGTISGVTASTAGIGGPPVALLFQNAKGSEIRGSMAGFFVVGTLVTMIGLNIADKFGVDEFLNGLALIPAAIAGFAMSGPMLPLVDRGWTRPAILVLSAAAAIALLLQLII